jgi:hypothetical protein
MAPHRSRAWCRAWTATSMAPQNIGGTEPATARCWKLAVSPALAAPVQLTAPASVSPGESFNLSYLVSNSYNGNVPGTNNYCFATNNAGDTTGWTGTFTGEPTSQTKMLTASTTTGIYTYALTCGGSETGTATVTVSHPTLHSPPSRIISGRNPWARRRRTTAWS